MYISSYPNTTKTIPKYQLPSIDPSGHRPFKRYFVSPILTVHTRWVWISIQRVKHWSKHIVFVSFTRIVRPRSRKTPGASQVIVSSEPPLTTRQNPTTPSEKRPIPDMSENVPLSYWQLSNSWQTDLDVTFLAISSDAFVLSAADTCPHPWTSPCQRPYFRVFVRPRKPTGIVQLM
jgi:hypothetical protein